MPVKIVKTLEDAKQVKFGESYVIDVYPDPAEEDQTITPEMMDEEAKLQQAIEDSLAEQSKEDVKNGNKGRGN